MKVVFVSCLLIFTASVCNADTSRIVGGDATIIDRYPSIVQVENKIGLVWAQSCAANILTTRFLLSAAQCFDLILVSRNRRIRAGSTIRNRGGTVVNIARATNHPSYSKWSYDGDISVVELASPLTFSDTIQRTAIITRDYVLPDDATVVLAGWGAVSQGGSSSTVLRHVEAVTINRSDCARRYLLLKRSVTSNMICAGVPNVGGRDHCDGDAGGPLYHENILVGIISWNYRCGHSTYPGVSTNVASYTDWIIGTAV